MKCVVLLWICFLFPAACSGFVVPRPATMWLSPLAPVSDARAPQQTSTQLSLSPEVLTNFLPPVMGFMKSEWTVSYGYGFATSLSALSLLKRTPLTPDNPIFALQAASLIFYGLRLNVHLFVRNRISTRMQEFQKKMEERAEERGSRWKRAPIVLSCGFLYYALYMPLLLASKVSASNPVPSITMKVMKALVAAQWLGFVMGAVADATKTYVKKTKGEKTLVTSGIFSLLRHPNYTGEIIAWSCNALLGALAGAYVLGDMAHKIGLLGITFVGWVGITFVLLAATRSLEERQKKDYGDKEDYKKWVDSTWSGWYLPKNEKDTALLEVPEITLDDETEEESGSGI